MKFHRINKDTIRVLINKEDLKKHGIGMLDLLGNREKCEQFFYSILDEADVEKDFTDTDTVLFQILPSQDGLELFISQDKNISNRVGDNGGMMPPLNEIEQDPQPVTVNDVRDKYDIFDKKLGKRTIPIKFNSFDDLIGLANKWKEVTPRHAVELKTDLYQYQNSYLVLFRYHLNGQYDSEGNTNFKDLNHMINDEMGIVYEYGQIASVTENELKKHGKQITTGNALETIAYYFN
ncbi:adaptor protein MecA [Fructilactobacillus fructivorans]|uniref:Adaptor protein MecA n=1 Tax=Fructilactobacillus fructivorans TaxID=1614 RepID=A0AAE6TWE2_9LACO|nr:adaptor protein MecA [Fructilactobacillus fructivorans]KRK58844.1 adaptor protein [Fructilactobacillus fructivorans]KRN39543.1 adaptor protein [Fructilactobacillus fructivorans]KRN43262.1 adaptor protein [Fructilactobacillus fructivorans]QFX92836.1 hypothetical protein LF543_04350 [Fructilactobacillus fructivorans]RDV65572.1 hypothetical protein DXU76_00060 [Fructilactobacillus fructivorans]